MKYGKLVENKIVYAPSSLIIDGTVIVSPNETQYLMCGWKKLDFSYPTDPAGDKKHWENDGYIETDKLISIKWKVVDDPVIYRTFSKLKVYGVISSLPPSNDTTAWQKIQTWLEGKTINGMNGWLSFNLATVLSEDHPLFASLAEEARILLGLSVEQFDELLNQCIYEA